MSSKQHCGIVSWGFHECVGRTKVHIIIASWENGVANVSKEMKLHDFRQFSPETSGSTVCRVVRDFRVLRLSQQRCCWVKIAVLTQILGDKKRKNDCHTRTLVSCSRKNKESGSLDRQAELSACGRSTPAPTRQRCRCCGRRNSPKAIISWSDSDTTTKRLHNFH